MQPEQQYRKPTVAEAVENMKRPLFKAEFQVRSIALWREKYGDAFANQVRALAIKKIKANRKQKVSEF